MRPTTAALRDHSLGVQAGSRAAQLDWVAPQERCGERGRGRRVPDPHLPHADRRDAGAGRLGRERRAGEDRRDGLVTGHRRPFDGIGRAGADPDAPDVVVVERLRDARVDDESSATAARASTQTAAPPAAKFATICRVTSCG